MKDKSMSEHRRHDSFDDVAVLASDEQRVLLESGDPVERVWAAWALGLELGRGAVPHLLASMGDEPSAGTRRQLLVVLAGLGERQVLRVLAQSDPDEYVRATALQYLVRTTPNDEGMMRFATYRLLTDTAPVVRRTVLQEVVRDVRSLDREHLEALVTDADLDVRRLALETLVATAPFEGLFPALFVRCIATESDFELRMWLTDLCVEAGRDVDVLRSATTCAEPTSGELLDRLVHHRRRFGWPDLVSLTRRDDPETDWRVLSLLDSATLSSAFGWMLGRVARAGTIPNMSLEAWRARRYVKSCADEAELRLRELFATGRPIVVTDGDRPALLAAIAYLEERRERFRTELALYADEWEDEEEWEGYEPDPWSLEEALRSLYGPER